MTDLRGAALRASSQQEQSAAADALVAHGTPADIAYVVAHLHYPGPVFGALGVALVRGNDLWPVVEALLDQRSNDVASFVASWLRKTSAARFAEIVERSPELAARAAGAVEWKDFAPIAPLVVALAAHDDATVREHARRALRYQQPVPMAALSERLAVADGEERTDLAYLVARERVASEAELDVRDPRVWMRVALVKALYHARAARWPSVLALASDDDPAVRADALTMIKTRALKDPSLLPSVELVRDWLTRTNGEVRDDIVAVLSFLSRHAAVATREWGIAARTTRACASCDELGRHLSWSDRDDPPKVYAALVPVHGSILRCPDCAAHFNYAHEVDVEVTSASETFWLSRLTRRMVAAHLDHAHPRVKEWEAALFADLDHPEPAVRSAAAWEIAIDLGAEKQLARVEELLLHHPATEVVREGLAVLRGTCRLQPCPVSRDVLNVLTTHSNATVQHDAAFLLTVKEPEWTLRDGPAGEGQLAALHGLREAIQIAPPARALPLVQTALRARPMSRWSFFPNVAEIAFAAADRAESAAAVLDALPSEAAVALAGAIPPDLLGTPAALRRALAANDRAVIAACVTAGAPVSLAETFFVAELARAEHEQIPNAIKAAFARGDVCDALFVPLCRFCERRRYSYETGGLLAQWAATRDVPAAEALPTLQLLVDEASGSFHDDIVRATTSVQLRTKNDAGLLALLSHPLYSTRGIAAGTLAKAKAVVSAAVHARLTEMAAAEHWYPQGEAKSALQLVSKSSA